jgi:acyl-CoA dehydrogenase
MHIIYHFGLLLAAIGFVSFTQTSQKKLLVCLVGAEVLATFLFGFNLFTMILVVVPVVLIALPEQRLQYLSKPVYDFFKKVLPPMTDTEKEALEAGDVWVDGDLFQGSPDWKKLLAIPKPELSIEEQSFMDNEVETLCKMLDDWKIVNEEKDLPEEVWAYIKEQGFMGLIIPKAFGGKQFSAIAHSTIVSKIASRSASTSVSVMVPNSLGPAELLMHYGTDEQKNQYLPTLASGQDIPCFALTGPEAGSDAGAIPDKGVICHGEHNGDNVLGIRLSWNKRYITLAPVATVLGLAFKLYDPEGLIGEQEDLGITCALIPTSHPGVETGRRHIPMGMAFMNGPTTGQDVFIPIDWIIGGQEYAGKGWRMLVECLSAGRAISLPSLGCTTGKMAYRMTGNYARIRKQFKTAIGHFEGVQEAMARIAGMTYKMEATRIMTAGAVDLGIKPSVVSAIAKYHLTEMGRQTMNDAMDVHGGRGLILGERNYLAAGYMSNPIAITVEGANILTRNLMIFGQGAVRCHPYVFAEMQASQKEDQASGLAEFDQVLLKHLGYGAKNFIRTLLLGLSHSRFFVRSPVGGPTAKHFKHLTRMSSALALVSDISMLVLGGELKRKERLSARLGDVLSELYMATAVVKYFEDSGRRSEDVDYVDWCIKSSLFNIQTALYDFCDNFPIKSLGWSIKQIIFPYGRVYKAPSDDLEQGMVLSMLEDSDIRRRLSKGLYINNEPDDVTGRMEHAFELILKAWPVEKKIYKALKHGFVTPQDNVFATINEAKAAEIITESEAELIIAAETARSDAIQVDDYSKEYVKSTGCKPNKEVTN